MDAKLVERMQALLPTARKVLDKKNPTEAQVLEVLKAAGGNKGTTERVITAMVLFDGLNPEVPNVYGAAHRSKNGGTPKTTAKKPAVSYREGKTVAKTVADQKAQAAKKAAAKAEQPIDRAIRKIAASPEVKAQVAAAAKRVAAQKRQATKATAG